MNDLRITLTYEQNAARRTGAELLADPSDDQPGWFVRAYRNEGYNTVAKITRVEPLIVLDAVRPLDGAIDPTQRPLQVAVAAVNRQHKSDQAARKERAEKLIRDGQRILAQIEAESR